MLKKKKRIKIEIMNKKEKWYKNRNKRIKNKIKR